MNVATATKEMPKSAAAKEPAFFQNNLSDDRDSVQLASSLIDPLSYPIYDALQASDNIANRDGKHHISSWG